MPYLEADKKTYHNIIRAILDTFFRIETLTPGKCCDVNDLQSNLQAVDEAQKTLMKLEKRELLKCCTEVVVPSCKTCDKVCCFHGL